MNIKYLGNHAERISHLTELREGEIYVVGRGRDAFIAFVMPRNGQRDKISPGSYTFSKIPIYEARLKSCGKEIDSEKTMTDDVHVDEFLDVEVMGVFRPTQESKLRKIIEERLGLAKADLVAKPQ